MGLLNKTKQKLEETVTRDYLNSEKIQQTLSNSSIKINLDVPAYTVNAALKKDFVAKNVHVASKKLNFRENDELRITEDKLLYTYYNNFSKRVHVYGIRAEDIEQIMYSPNKECLYLVAAYKMIVFDKGEVVEQSNYIISDGIVLVIPMCFNKNEEIIEKIKSITELEIEEIQ